MLVDINLLPERERERSQLVVGAIAILAGALLVYLIFSMLAGRLEADTEQLDKQIITLQEEQQALQDERPTGMIGQRTDLAATVQFAEANRYETLPLIRDMVALLPERGFFQEFEFEQPHNATVMIQFDDKQEASFYLARLLASESVTSAALESVVAVPLESDDGKLHSYEIPRYEATYVIEFADSRSAEIENTGEPLDTMPAGEELTDEGEGADE